MTTSSHAVVVMARAPDGARPPKTRLAGIVPDERQRRRLYAAFLSDIVGRCGSLRNTALRVAYAADGGTAGFERAGVRADCLMPQRGETLGERERGVFEDLFLAGFSAVVMIGSDLPTLPIDRVTGALARLRDASRRVVLGPAADGGYYLIGLTRPPAGRRCRICSAISAGAPDRPARTRSRRPHAAGCRWRCWTAGTTLTMPPDSRGCATTWRPMPARDWPRRRRRC